MLALRLFAADPAGLGGVVLRAPTGPVRSAWLEALAQQLPPGSALRRMPASIGDEAMLGGLDIAATLQAGRPVLAAGLLAACDGGVLVLAMAETVPLATQARLAQVLDSGMRPAVAAEAAAQACRFGIVALDEGMVPEERLGDALLDRLAFHVDLSAMSHRDLGTPDGQEACPAEPGPVVAADDVIAALCGACLAMGIASARAPILALRAARAAARLAGRPTVTMEDAALAARLVLAPRATMLPATGDAADEPQAAGEPETDPPSAADRQDGDGDGAAGTDMLLEAARAAIPAGLLGQVPSPALRAGSRPGGGGAGALQKATWRGRPVGVRAAAPDSRHRLNLIETLRAAAPWQRLRRTAIDGPARVLIRSDDFRVVRTEQPARSLTIFLVDASGSAALARLAEAKGAVELLLADCYRRRDQVALVAFRGTRADVLLPPTRSLVRAKRCLSALPGGGGTPMAAGIDAGFLLAERARRDGLTPTLVLLTDGRANVSRDGTGGRAAAQTDAAGAARRVRAARIAALLLDTSNRPAADASRLAAELGARYVPLPYANAEAVCGAVRAARA
jgi:magnesium chelatase subunit D